MSYRILSVDGGGAWALIQVKALIALYDPKATGHQILQDFDLVAANSGGSIILGGLVGDMPLRTLLARFQIQSTRQSDFSPTHSFGDKLLHDLTAMGPKYSAENKLPASETGFPKTGTQTLSDAVSGVQRPNTHRDVHVLITAFDYDRNRATFFRSSPASGPAWGIGETSDTTLAEAIHVSTNAPVNYFDAPATFPDRPGRYWDGAIPGFNNPVLAAVTEAIVLKQNPSDLAVLSIGTASVALLWPQSGDGPSPYLQQIANRTLTADLRKLATSTSNCSASPLQPNQCSSIFRR